MNMRSIVLFLLLIPVTIFANVMMMPFAEYTSGRFFTYDIWWIALVLLLEIVVFYIFVKGYTIKKITLAVLLANAISAIIGWIFTWIPYGSLAMSAVYEILSDTFASFDASQLDRVLMVRLMIIGILMLVVNTIIEFLVYWQMLPSTSKKRLFLTTLIANVIGTFGMMVIVVLSGKPLRGEHSPYAIATKYYSKDELETKTELPKERSSKSKSRAISRKP